MAPRRQRLGDLVSTGRELFDLLVGAGASGFELFELEQQASERVVAGFRSVSPADCRGDRLAEKAELGGEGGAGFALDQLVALALDTGPHPVHLGEHAGDLFKHRGADPRIVHDKIAHGVGDQVHRLGQCINGFEGFGGLQR